MSTTEQVQAERAFGIELVQYAGQWVAVQDRTVLDNDKALGALLDRLNGQRETAEIFKVREDPTAPCG
jgi:hypothetical protein